MSLGYQTMDQITGTGNATRSPRQKYERDGYEGLPRNMRTTKVEEAREALRRRLVVDAERKALAAKHG